MKRYGDYILHKLAMHWYVYEVGSGICNIFEDLEKIYFEQMLSFAMIFILHSWNYEINNDKNMTLLNE